MDTEQLKIWVSQPNVCRCCLSANGTFDLQASYVNEDGQDEVYCETLQNCFGINMMFQSDSSLSTYICIVCTEHLRHANKFRLQVMKTEQSFMQYLNMRGDYNVKVEPQMENNHSPDDYFITCSETTKVPKDKEKSDAKKKKVKEKEIQETIDWDSDTPLKELARVKEIEDEFNCELSMKEREGEPMEFSTDFTSKAKMDTVSTDNIYGECRCCLARGSHRDMKKEYHDNGVREVYFDIFKESLNLPLSKHSELTTLICYRCVTRLRDACAFRLMSAGTERHLLSRLGGNCTVFVNVDETNMLDCEVKNEPVRDVKTEVSEHEGYDSDFITDDFHASPVGMSNGKALSQLEAETEAEAALLARHSRLAPLPRRHTLFNICPDYIRQLDILAHLEVTPSMIPMLEESRQSQEVLHKNTYISEKAAHITNATILIKFSNITPFRSKTRSGYPCFYCRMHHEDFTKLREHTLEHKATELIKVLKQFGTESMVIYADVYALQCTLCNEKLTNINELKSHLTRVHDKKLIKDVSDRVIPFKIEANKYRCQICECTFETFGSIERHMNGHYRNYVCKDCGTGFITKYRLKVHCKSMHADGSFPCELCGKMFTTQQKYKNHVNTVHKLVKRFKCPKCPERFSEYFRRQKHMVDSHGVAPLKYNCNVCDRSFDRRYTLSRHLKRDHLEERDFECEICSYRCFTKNELKVHMVKHNGERIFECSVCKKSYARKKTLREHMRIHNNDRRFVCPACGQAFVQKCSLKGHLKTHHMEYLS